MATLSRRTLGYLAKGIHFTIPQNNFTGNSTDGLAGVGYLAPINGFTIPQNPFYGTPQYGMAGLGCSGGCGDGAAPYAPGFGRAYPRAYGQGMGDLTIGGTDLTTMWNNFVASMGSLTIPGTTTSIPTAYLLIGGVAAVLLFSGGHATGRRKRS